VATIAVLIHHRPGALVRVVSALELHAVTPSFLVAKSLPAEGHLLVTAFVDADPDTCFKLEETLRELVDVVQIHISGRRASEVTPIPHGRPRTH
jgi:hypothetical protein